MHTLTFHNIGNADSILISLDNGRRLLFDYADTRDPEDDDDVRCDLPRELRNALDDDESINVVAFTHLDCDHYAKATEFFYFDHIAKYQGDVDDEARIRMTEMWVPAAVITEPLPNDHAEAKAIQKEARERFKAKKGIRIFSRPERLREWCEKNDVDLDERKHLVTDAGHTAPEFTIKEDGVEFFVHSPFAKRQNECEVVDRNEDSLVLHATFNVDGRETKVFLASDSGHEILTDIVEVTESKSNKVRLEWDVFKLPHHCSHHALSSKERKGDKSEPEPKVARLFEHYRREGCVIVSTSDPIPEKGSKRDAKGQNPPHRQAANYYREEVVASDDDFRVTMEHPDADKPKPLVIQIDSVGVTVKKVRAAAAFVATTSRAPRAG